MNKESLSQDELKRALDYNPDTGIFTWRKKMARRVKVGAVVGHSRKGYLRVQLYGKFHNLHHLAWFYVYGEWPKGQIDHINGARDDNRVENLRDVDQNVNQRNAKQRKDNKSGITGVSWAANCNKWMAYITVDGKRTTLGFFTDKYRAASVRHLAMELHGGFTERHGTDV